MHYVSLQVYFPNTMNQMYNSGNIFILLVSPTEYILVSRLQTILERIGLKGPSQISAGAVDTRGPVFISYRQSDGTNLAIDTAWALRAAGVPVWHDRSDLPPGDTERRLAEAIASGLSGAVLLVTPELEHSSVVREIELPQLLELERNRGFTFSILSTIELDEGKLDYDAPDRLLRQPRGRLKRLKQEPALTQQQIAEAAQAHSQRRMRAVRYGVEAAGCVITIDIQTRIPPFATRVNADMVLRLRPPMDGQRRPNQLGLRDLKLFLADLPQLVALAGAEHATVRGGAHLTAAYALGAALPTTLIGRIDVLDTAGEVWSLGGNAPDPDLSHRLLGVKQTTQSSVSGGEILVYLDLLPARSDSAFVDLAARNIDRFASTCHIRPTRDGNLRADEAAAIVGEASRTIRGLVGKSQTSEVHLLLRSPWTVALLLGRTLNTIRARLYEWEDGPYADGNNVAPRYIPSLAVRSGAGGSPIERVFTLEGPE